MESRTIVVGDIHGCYDELMALVEKVNLGDRDRVVSVGDLITKGPKNREVLELFMTDPRFSTVIGNHDLQLRRKWCGEDVELKPAQREAHRELKGEKDHYASFLNRLPFWIDLGTHLVVHAGLGPKNREVLELFMTDPRFSTVIGNHDLQLRRKWCGEDVELKPAQREAHRELKGEKDHYASFLNRLPFWIDLGTHLVVHAGLRPN